MAGFVTVTEAVPAVAMSAAVIVATSIVLSRKVVARAEPFHWTVEVLTKFVPAYSEVKSDPTGYLVVR